MVKEKIVIGIDQSYNCTGITVVYNGTDILCMKGISFKGCKTNTDKRLYLSHILDDMLQTYRKQYPRTEIIIITERIRLYSQKFISETYIKSTGALVATIIDTAYKYSIPVYSVATISWKAQIVGTSKPLDNPYGINREKYPTILYLKKKGLLNRLVEPYKGKGKKGIIPIKIDGIKTPCKVNDDIADSYCICMYGFLSESKQKLVLETF